MIDAVFTYGRFNPPHLGHKKMIQEIVRLANEKGKMPVVVVSHSMGVRNPLSPEEKIAILRKWFPTGVVFMKSSKSEGIIKISNSVFAPNSIMVVGQNRAESFDKVLPTYKKVSINRDESAPSATKARNAAYKNNDETFKQLTGYKLEPWLVQRIRNLRNKKLVPRKPKLPKKV